MRVISSRPTAGFTEWVEKTTAYHAADDNDDANGGTDGSIAHEKKEVR